ncbi:unnamed protein product [Symbiodinium sp. CCMP2456]|nr:unnamed protein product [Symbiodinium sp. CCMP2456]
MEFTFTVVAFLVTAGSAVLLHLSMRLKSKAAEAAGADRSASSACLSLLRVAAGPFSDGLLFMVVIVIGVLVWTSGGEAGKIAGAPLAWGLLALHLSCAWLSRHVEKTCWRACSVGLFWHLLVITCMVSMVLPCGSDGDVLGSTCLSLLLVPCSAMLLDYKSTVLLSLVSTGTAACCHVSTWARPSGPGGSGGPRSSSFDSLVLALILDAMTFFAAFAAASALHFWQRNAVRESAMLRVLAVLSDAQVMLDSKLLILDPSAKFCDIVRMDASDVKALQALSFLSFLHDEEEQLKFKTFLQKSCAGSQVSPAAAIHLSMRDAANKRILVEVFHSPAGKDNHLLVLREVSSHLRVDASGMPTGLDVLPAVPDIQSTNSGFSRTVTASDVSCSTVRDLPEFAKLVLDVDVSTRRLAVKTATLNFSDEGDLLSFVDYLEPRVRRPFTEWLRMQAAQQTIKEPHVPENSNVFGRPLDFRVSGTSSRMKSMQVRCVGRTGPESQDESGSEAVQTRASTHDETNGESDSELDALQRLVDTGLADFESLEELLATQEEALARRCHEVQARIESLKAPQPTWTRIELEQFVQQR